LRDTVKWIMAAFTTGSAIMFSGLTVNSISALAQSGRWQLPLALAAVPLVAAIGAVIASVRVIIVTPRSPGSLFPEYWKKVTGTEPGAVRSPSGLTDELPAVLGAYGTTDDFEKRLVSAWDAKEAAASRLDETPERRADYDKAVARLDVLQQTLKEALDCEAYLEGKRRYRMAWKVVVAALLVAVGSAAASGIVAGDRERDAPPAAASFSAPVPVTVWFTGNPPPAAGGAGACPVWNGMPAYLMGGSEARPLLLFPGYAASYARGHGTQGSVTQCSRPWLWPAATGEVLVVPR